MCCCGKPTVNGQPNAYSWDGKTFITRKPDPPALDANDALIYDEPGRCGGVDSHCHHFRLVGNGHDGSYAILVRHGGGDRRIQLGSRKALVMALHTLNSDGRYWLMQSIYHTVDDAVREEVEKVEANWRQAAVDKRIKVNRRTKRALVSIADPK